MYRKVLLAIALAAPYAAAGELFNEKVGSLEPFPREVARGKDLELIGSLRGAYKAPELIIIAPDGKTFLNKDNEVRGWRFVFTVDFEHGPGRYRMEVIARKPKSIRSLARFSVWYGRRRPAVDPEPLPPEGPAVPLDVHPRLIEKRILRMLNEFRRSIGVPEVGWNEAVAARAREHASRMAAARRRIHKFSGVGGVTDMLRRDGAGPGGLSGPDDPWDKIRDTRPFGRPAPQPPGPNVFNYVVPFVLDGISPEVTFETHFVREAAFRICAADPHCVEVAVGAAHHVPKKKEKGKRTVYYSVCFVQVNALDLIKVQDRAFEGIYTGAATRSPKHLRVLGNWGRRGKALKLLARVRQDPRPEVAAAAFDGLLLLDEERAWKELTKTDERARYALKARRWATAAALWAPYGRVLHDRRIARKSKEMAALAERRALEELTQVLALEGTKREKALKSLLRRSKGLPAEERIRKELEA